MDSRLVIHVVHVLPPSVTRFSNRSLKKNGQFERVTDERPILPLISANEHYFVTFFEFRAFLGEWRSPV